MYLKEIKLSGFKSFADNITIKLDRGISCLVGPNGSGKSNIIDAIRFVLGEQSVKSLRGNSTMTDLIFSGSKNRKPLNVASVSLTFDNSDNYLKIPFKEVNVKRRVYRSGENDYFINGEKVRLKDINNLFLDTGLAKNSFSIVGQGEISKILSNSPQDRRSIIEVAAGVYKYKEKKEESLRKLLKVDTNLTRVKDILNELRLRRDPLKEQYHKALKYLSINEKLETLEISLLSEKIFLDNTKLKEEEKLLESLKDKLLDLENKNNEYYFKEENLKKSIREKELELEDLNNNLMILIKDAEELKNKKEQLNEELRFKLSKEQEELEYLRINNLLLEKNKDINLLESKISHERSNFNDLEEEFLNINEELKRVNEDLRRSTNELSSIRRNIDLSLSRKTYLESIIDSKTIPNRSLRAVLNNPRLRGVDKTIDNIFTARDEIEIAKEVAISSNRYNLAVKDDDSAREIVKYLKDNDLGRLTFYPLSSIKRRYISSDYLDLIKNESGFVGILSNLLEYDLKYSDLAANLFGNIIIADNLDNAFRISELCDKKFRVITLDGSIVNPLGSITGGSLKRFDNASSSKKELRELEEKLKTDQLLEKDLNNTINELDDKKSLINERIINIRSNLKLKEIETLNYEQELVELKQEKENLEFSLNKLKVENKKNIKNDLEDKFFKKEEEKEKALIAKLSLTKEIDKDKDVLEEVEANKRNTELEINKNKQDISKLEISINNKNIRIDNNLEVLSEKYSLTYEKAKDDYVLDLEIEDAEDKLRHFKREIASLGYVNVLAVDEYREVNERYQFLEKQENDLLNAKDSLNEIINQMDQILIKEFKKTFDEVNYEFSRIFKELFSGGDAELILTDPDNLLETGVDINASPPGKKLASISLLSGGEKTLTAISLIFAILTVKKIAFCIFDEIEAALDDENVLKFGKYLVEYSKDTEFLIVTHKKETMEYAKSLYGVTMEEEGISKVVSLMMEE